MRLISLLALLALPTSAFATDLKVLDGDTIVIGKEHIRIANIDAPEIHHFKCDAERRLGLVAKARLSELLMGHPVVIKRGDGNRMKDRYGRTLAVIAVDGADVGEKLIAEELARPWKGKREPWCNMGAED